MGGNGCRETQLAWSIRLLVEEERAPPSPRGAHSFLSSNIKLLT